jgi:type VI secretion system secreted protein Hcp
MAMDMFMKIDGAPGEARDKVHAKEIDVLAWSWGMSNSGTAQEGPGAGAGKVNVQDLSFTKWIDVSTPVLMLYCSNGKHIDKCVLTVRKAGEQPLEYLIITMEQCMVTAVSTGGSGGEDRLTENVTINFANVELQYKEQTAKGGVGDTKFYKWKIAENVAG